MSTPYEQRRERERRDPDAESGPCDEIDDEHTPGPWEVGPRHESVRPAIATVLRGEGPINDGCVICTMRGERQRPANAHLIAAAPDLLLALRLIVENPDHDLLPSERADAEAALRKAAGEG